MEIDHRKDYLILDYLYEFLVEAFEILILYIIYNLIVNNKEFDILKTIKLSLLISAFSNALEWYNPILRNQMRTGILSNVGAAMIKIK